jgi:hypothetical protein
MAVSDQYFDPQLRAHTLAADLVACADALSALAGQLLREIGDTDPDTADDVDGRLLSTYAALSTERNKLRRLASDVRSLAAVIR